ncbi:MAG: DEAD/DEAH box helicase [Methylomicrobium sp.]|nr:DEAD/DEAH box helicase [Methylomicrobium sp.]
MNQKAILNSDIRYECSDSAFAGGMDYFLNEKVTDVSIDEKNDSAVLVSSVKGMGKKGYEQKITVLWKNNFKSISINGRCSCTVGYNCKHVAAVCLYYQKILAHPKVIETHTADCLRWLEAYAAKPESKSDFQEFLAYLLIPGSKPYGYILDLMETRQKPAGGLSKGKKTSINNLRYNYSYSSFIQAEDEEIIRLLTALKLTPSSQPIIAGAAGHLVLTKLISTGRLFYLDLENSPLTPGEPRQIQFNWQKQDCGDYQLLGVIEPEAKLIRVTPPLYLDESQNRIGALDTRPLSAEQASYLMTAPPVPEVLVEQFSEMLIFRHPDFPVPPPQAMDLIELKDIAPRPHLILLGKEEGGRHYNHFVKMGFDYGDVLLFDQEYVLSVVKGTHGVLRIHRDQEREREALARLTGLGFEWSSADKNERLLWGGLKNSSMDNPYLWRDFLEVVCPQLQQEGWVIEKDASFLMQFQMSESFDAEIEEKDSDWFDMSFNVTIDGKSLPLLPLIMPVLEHYDLDSLPDRLNISVGTHNYLSISSDQLQPILNVLYELFNTGLANGNGTLKLSRYDAASLVDVEERSYGVFSIRGGKSLRELGRKLKNFSGIGASVLPQGLNAELRGYQRQGLNWLQFLREYHFAGILADDMGLGKTIQTLTHLLLEKEAGRLFDPCLIVAPTSLMGNWRREAERFTPGLKVLTLQGADRKSLFDKIDSHDLILTTYPLLSRDADVLLKSRYYYLILDEAQMIKNPKTNASKFVRQIKATHRLSLTGTPMENHLGELWAQFDFLMPGFLGDSAFFKRVYRSPIEMEGDVEQKNRLSRRLAPFLLRRTKQEVAKELPPKTEIIRSVPLYDKQAALYESIRLSMEQKVRAAIEEKGLARSHITILDALLKLRQTCCDPRTLPLKEAQKVKESAKLDLLMEMLPELLEEGRRILVFSQFTKMLRLIEVELIERNIPYTQLTGQTKDRDEVINTFTSGAVNVFLISLKAGGVGLNLTQADTVIIYDPWWNPAVESQAADRAYRIGQDKPVFVYKLMTENTVEEKILKMQEKKRALADEVYQEDAGKIESLTLDDLTSLFKPV